MDSFLEGTWRIIPVSEWLITTVSESPGVVPLPNGVILTTYDTWDDPPSNSIMDRSRCIIEATIPSKFFTWFTWKYLLFPKEIPAFGNHHFLSVPCSTLGGKRSVGLNHIDGYPLDVKMWLSFRGIYSFRGFRLVSRGICCFRLLCKSHGFLGIYDVFFFWISRISFLKIPYFVRLFSAYLKTLNPIHTCICI